MSLVKTHRQLALDNFRLADDAASTEWAITIFFYSAVHAVNHAVHGKNFAPPSYRHEQRRQDILSHPLLIPISVSYTDLEGLSRDARYSPQYHPMILQKRDHTKTLAQSILRAVGLKPPT